MAKFTTAVFDLEPIHGDFRNELPKSDPGYYFRPHKTILVRTVKDGGEKFLFYVGSTGRHFQPYGRHCRRVARSQEPVAS